MTTVQDQALANLKWSDAAEYRLTEFVDQFTLPQVVKVLEGFHGTQADSCISSGQVLTLHSVKTTEKALVRDGQNKKLCIPLNCNHKVELCPDSTEQLPKFKFARVTYDYLRVYGHEKVPVRLGDKLQVVHVKRSARGKKDQILFQNLNNKESLILPLSLTAGLQPLVDGREYYLKEVSMMRLPVFFQFIDTHEPVDHRQFDENVFNSSLGVLKFEQVYRDSSVICTTKEGGMRTVVTCPKTLPILVAVAQGALVGDKDYVRLCNVFHAGVSLSRIENMESENIYASPDSIREYQYVDVADSSPQTKPPGKAERRVKKWQEVGKCGSLDSAAKERPLQAERRHSAQESIYEDPEALRSRRKVALSPPTSPTSPDPNTKEVVADSNGPISQMSVNEVSNFLKSWRLGQFVEVFSENDVDGEILVSLNAQDMTDLGMNSFQSKKLLKLISGWRPKTDRA